MRAFDKFTFKVFNICECMWEKHKQKTFSIVEKFDTIGMSVRALRHRIQEVIRILLKTT